MDHVNGRDDDNAAAASPSDDDAGIVDVDVVDLDDIVNVEENVDVTAQSSVPLSKGGDSAYPSPSSSSEQQQRQKQLPPPPVDKALTRMVQDRIYGLTRTPDGTIQYSTSMLDANRAVQFREGVRLGRALPINVDRLCHFAKKDMSHGRLEEAQGFYAQAKDMDPTDGRSYLGFSRIAQRRGDLERARGLLREGIARSTGGYVVVRGPGKVAVVEGGGGGKGGGKKKRRNKRDGGNGSEENANIVDGDRSDVGFEEEEGSVIGTIPDLGPNPFLLQALGSLEQELGNLSAAEELYLQALRSRPSHAAAGSRWRSSARGSCGGDRPPDGCATGPPSGVTPQHTMQSQLLIT